MKRTIKTLKSFNESEKSISLTYLNDVVYTEYNNVKLHLQIIMPTVCNFKPDLYPCLLYVQGSGWFKQPLYYQIPSLSKLAMKGYVVAIVEYRPSDVVNFPGQIIDTKKAINFIKKNALNYHVDADNVFIGGDSSGAHCAIMSALTNGIDFFSDKKCKNDITVKGIIDFFAPIDFRCFTANEDVINIGAAFLGDESLIYDNETLDKVSPITYIKGQNVPPVLMFHGSDDHLVPIKNSDNFFEALEKNNCKVDYYILESSDHGGNEYLSDEIIKILDEFILSNAK